jgi:hypothetical protein
MTLRNGKEGRDFILSTAHLDRSQLIALRLAIDCLLRGGDIPVTLDETKDSKGALEETKKR